MMDIRLIKEVGMNKPGDIMVVTENTAERAAREGLAEVVGIHHFTEAELNARKFIPAPVLAVAPRKSILDKYDVGATLEEYDLDEAAEIFGRFKSIAVVLDDLGNKKFMITFPDGKVALRGLD